MQGAIQVLGSALPSIPLSPFPSFSYPLHFPYPKSLRAKFPRMAQVRTTGIHTVGGQPTPHWRYSELTFLEFCLQFLKTHLFDDDSNCYCFQKCFFFLLFNTSQRPEQMQSRCVLAARIVNGIYTPVTSVFGNFHMYLLTWRRVHVTVISSYSH